MRVKIKLMGMLKERTPKDGYLELPKDGTIADVLAALQIDSLAVQAFSVNGTIERDQSTRLNDEDELVVLAPVGGG